MAATPFSIVLLPFKINDANKYVFASCEKSDLDLKEVFNKTTYHNFIGNLIGEEKQFVFKKLNINQSNGYSFIKNEDDIAIQLKITKIFMVINKPMEIGYFSIFIEYPTNTFTSKEIFNQLSNCQFFRFFKEEQTKSSPHKYTIISGPDDDPKKSNFSTLIQYILKGKEEKSLNRYKILVQNLLKKLDDDKDNLRNLSETEFEDYIKKIEIGDTNNDKTKDNEIIQDLKDYLIKKLKKIFNDKNIPKDKKIINLISSIIKEPQSYTILEYLKECISKTTSFNNSPLLLNEEDFIGFKMIKLHVFHDEYDDFARGSDFEKKCFKLLRIPPISSKEKADKVEAEVKKAEVNNDLIKDINYPYIQTANESSVIIENYDNFTPKNDQKKYFPAFFLAINQFYSLLDLNEKTGLIDTQPKTQEDVKNLLDNLDELNSIHTEFQMKQMFLSVSNTAEIIEFYKNLQNVLMIDVLNRDNQQCIDEIHGIIEKKNKVILEEKEKRRDARLIRFGIVLTIISIISPIVDLTSALGWSASDMLLLILVVIVLLFVGLYFFFKNKNDEAK